MFVSAYSGLAPILWSGEHLAASLYSNGATGALDPAGLLNAATTDTGEKRAPPPSFFISDILYPSVIPLPGTLPTAHSPPASNTSSSPSSPLSPAVSGPVSAAPGSTPVSAPRSAPPSAPIVPPRASVIVLQPRSRDLKFGIDRILSSSSPPTSDVTHKEKHAPATAQRSEISSSISRSPTATTCPCSSPTCTTPIRHHPPPPPLSFHPLGFGGGGGGMGGLRPPPHHPAHHPALYPHPPPSHHHHHHPHQGRELFHRTSTYPGPYSVLGGSSDGTSNGGAQSPAKRKRSWSRAVFSNLQRKGLEKRFEVQKYVTKPDRRQLAAMLGLTDAQVKVWFQNRRMKWRHAEEQKKKREADEKNKSSDTLSSPESKEDKADNDPDEEECDGELSLEIDVESCQESDDDDTEMTLTLQEKVNS